MKLYSVSDIVFLMVASTMCYLAVVGKPVDPQFLVLVGGVFSSFYVHKAQNKPVATLEPNTTTSTTTTNTNNDI